MKQSWSRSTHPWRQRIGEDVRLSSGAPAAGLPLPAGPRAQLEELFAADLSHLRLHVGPQPAQLGVRAFAHGTDLYFSPGQLRSWNRDTLAVTAHELVHVFQQMKGQREERSAPWLCWAPPDEALAEQVADLVQRGDPAARQAIRQGLGQVATPHPRTVGWAVVQPHIEVFHDDKLYHVRGVDEAINLMLQHGTDQTINKHLLEVKNNKEFRSILHNWIHASTKQWKRFVLRQKEHTVHYESWDSLARSLLGELRSRGNADREVQLAKETEASEWVQNTLGKYLQFVYITLERFEFAPAKMMLTNSYKGAYASWYPSGGIMPVLENPYKYPLKSKVAALHDLDKPFGAVDPVTYLQVPKDKSYTHVLVPNKKNGYFEQRYAMSDEEGKTFMLQGKDTLFEDSEIVKAFREKDLPMEFGPSYTTGKTCQLCTTLCQKFDHILAPKNIVKKKGFEFSPASLKHHTTMEYLSACVWSLFAFWTLYYYKQYSRAHTFHEVMSTAKNYGLPYMVLHYPDRVPTEADPFPMGEAIF